MTKLGSDLLSYIDKKPTSTLAFMPVVVLGGRKDFPFGIHCSLTQGIVGGGPQKPDSLKRRPGQKNLSGFVTEI